MNRVMRIMATAVLAIVFMQAMPVLAEVIHCTECGMMVDVNSKYAGRIVQTEKTIYFCDIGDLFSYIKRKSADGARIEVKDNVTGSWIDATKAYYVRDEKKFRTPMGWGVAAFQDAKRAAESGAASDFESMAKTLK